MCNDFAHKRKKGENREISQTSQQLLIIKIKKNTTNPLIINLEVFGGNINGVISKLDYLQELGVTTIYLNPISLANSNHKYDTADYMKIDDMFGTEKEFKTLIELSKERNIKLVIDGVYNHTGSDSIYFNREGTFDTLGAYKSKDSRFYNWYEFEEYPNKYKSWWGIDTLPSIRHDCDEFQDYVAGKNGVLEKYLSLGIFGVRLDVVDEITEDVISKNLYTSNIPDPDLLIRTGGEKRISNYLLWQAAYSEIYVTDIFWPEFDEKALADAILEFQSRNRRFGK